MDRVQDLAKFIVDTGYDDIPAEAISYAKTLFLDILSTTIAGSSAKICPEVAEKFIDWGGKPESTVLVHGKKLPAPEAAFVNSMMAHACDLDETYDECSLHSGITVIPACLAAAEAAGRKISGKEFLTAVVVAVEVVTRLALSIKATFSEIGWLFSCICAYPACAAGAAKIFGLNQEQTANAIGIVYSQQAGLLQATKDGALSKRMQPAFGARAGVLSASLAQLGVTGIQNVLEGTYGFYPQYAQNKADINILFENLGKRFEIGNLAYKPYPCCRHTHTAIEAVIQLVKEHQISIDDIERIDVEITENGANVVCEPREARFNPKNVVEAQFSIPYAIAVALLKGNVTLADFNDAAVGDPAIREITSKIHASVNDTFTKEVGKGATPCLMTIHTKKGSYATIARYPKGHPSNPMTFDDLLERLETLKPFSLYPIQDEKLSAAMNILRELETLDDISDFVNTLNQAFCIS